MLGNKEIIVPKGIFVTFLILKHKFDCTPNAFLLSFLGMAIKPIFGMN